MTQQQSDANQSMRLPSTVKCFGYGVVGSDLRLREMSSSFQQLVGQSQLGEPLSDVLFAFAGMETNLISIMEEESPYWFLQGVAHTCRDTCMMRYFDILTLPDWSEDGLFVVVHDVSFEMAYTRRFVQQRNEAQLRTRNNRREQKVGWGDTESVENTRQVGVAGLQGLDEIIRVATTATIGNCLRLLVSTPEDLQLTQMVLASCLEIDQALDSLLAEAHTTQSIEATTPQDMAALIRDVASAYRVWAGASEVEIDISPDEIPIVHGFGILLRAAIALLLVHAIHHSPSDRRIDLAVLSAQDGVLIKINGRDIACPAIVENSEFEACWRNLDMGASANDRAAQLSLCLVHAVASAHRGRFWAERLASGDTDLCLWLPTEVKRPLSATSEGGSP